MIINYNVHNRDEQKIISLRLIDYVVCCEINEVYILRNLLWKAFVVLRVYIVQRKMLFSGPNFRERIFPCYFPLPSLFVISFWGYFHFLSRKKNIYSTAHQQTESTSFTCVEIPNNLKRKIPLSSTDVLRENPKDMFEKIRFHNGRIRYDEFEFLL